MSSEETLVDIQNFSLHDGPGIRTTVFLKGCPLRCKWCSNPETFTKTKNLSYSVSKCIQCHQCVDVCPAKALTVLDNKLTVNHDACNHCGNCVEQCVQDALKIYGYTTTAEEVIDIVKKDKAFFDNSGGGVTLSGGEVMLQSDFTLEILTLAKKNNIHTCIETCGFAKTGRYEKILPFVDVFLFDYKATDPIKHKRLTEHDNTLILQNLKFLNSKKASIVLRCPLIQGVNDDEGHLVGIADISNKFSAIIAVEIMPFHNFGIHKYAEIGLKPPTYRTSASPEIINYWKEQLLVLGCTKLKR